MDAHPRRWFRPALALWIAVGVAASVRTLHRPESHTVFPVFAAGAAHWWADQPLYANYEPLDYFRYPPLFAIFFTPIAALGPRLGGVLWVWLGLGIYGFGLRRAARDLLPGRWTPRRESVFLILALVGALPGLWNGQSNAVIVGLLLMGASALARERWWAGASLLAASVALKLTPLPLALLCCALYPRALAGRFALALSVALLLPFLTRPPDVVSEQYRGLAGHLKESATERWPGFRDGWTVWVVTRHLARGEGGIPNLKAPMDGSWYRVVQMAGGLAVLGLALRLRRRGERSPREVLTLTLALGSGWLMLLGPASEHPTYVFLAPWLAWGFVQRGKAAGRRWVEASALLVLVLGWAGLTRPLWGGAPWLLLFLPAGVICFLVWAVRRAWKRSDPPGGRWFEKPSRMPHGGRRGWGWLSMPAPVPSYLSKR